MLLSQFNLKIRELAQSALVIKDLINKAKQGADSNDKNLQEILSKWQAANEQTLNRYPHDKI